MKQISFGQIIYNSVERSILYHLFKHRFLTVNQLIMLIHPELIDRLYPQKPEGPDGTEMLKKRKAKYGRIHKEITRMEKYGYVRSQLYIQMVGKRAVSYYTLHDERLEEVKSMLDIDVDVYGSGWDDDFGDLDIDLFEFPKRIEHHSEMIDFMIQLKGFKLDGRELQADYIDSIYSVREIPDAAGKNLKLKPDGEFRIHYCQNEQRKRIFYSWLEIDRTTERSEALMEKFERYGRFYEHAKSSGIEHPPLIYFHSNSVERIGRRWKTVLNAYLAAAKTFGPFMNLFLSNTQLMDTTFKSFLGSTMMRDNLQRNVQLLTQKDMGFLGDSLDQLEDLFVKTSEVLSWRPRFVITRNDPKKVQLYLFQKLDCYETFGICQVLDFIRKWPTLPSELVNEVHELIPVFYFGEGSPLGLPPLTTITEAENAVLTRAIWYSATENKWYDHTQKPIPPSINPLTFGLHQ
ncbi:DNA-binding PadR family transcriptional regulator [Paenibacillus mucilaginosus]|uniref:replication-relaxation family protein n=1 Tax=Paenibacillus mucilaginosus TaxID=61624 RepID=UPI003D1950AD